MKRSTCVLALLVVAVLPAAAEPSVASGYAVEHLRVIDGSGAPAVEDATLVVRGDRIVSVGSAPPPPDLPRIDGAGWTVLPGLVDAHVHLGSVPGAVVRGDGRAEIAAQRAAQLRAYVACGVTTVLDAAPPRDGLAWVREHVARGGAAPDVRMLAPFLTPRGGYFADADLRGDAYADLWSPIDGVDDLRAALDAAAGLPGVVGVKVTMETGVGPVPVWTGWSAEMRAAIRDEARARGLPVYVHSMGDDAHRDALELEPRALVHGGYADDAPSDATLGAMRAAGVFVVSTLGIHDGLLLRYERERLDDPQLARVVPAAQRATADDDAAWERVARDMVAVNAPGWVPRWLRGPAARVFLSERAMRRRLERALAGVRAMHEAGVTVVVGTDSGTWPLMTSSFHGVSTPRELELLVRAGFTPLEAIRAATSEPARLLGLDDEVGRVAAGLRADLLFVEGDPGADIRVLTRVTRVARAGVLRTPAEWMRPLAPAPPVR